MPAPYRIQIFGKAGCTKCKTLNGRVDKLLAREEWQAFSKEYVDIMTVDGLIPFCEAECLNPQRIPAMLISRLNEETDEYDLVPNKVPGQEDEICGNSRLYQYLGLQTDYTDSGSGVISPKMIAAVLSDALRS